MNTINLSQYSPIISDKAIGDEIYKKIKNAMSKDSEITVDLNGIKSMATFCAKQIFGQLYVEIGSEKFFDKILIKNASEDVKTLIKIGIKNALDDRAQSKD